MVRERDVFGFGLERVREALRNGVFEPGAQVLTLDLARRLGSSVTPVREVLSRLVGEGLLEERRGAGLFTLKLGPPEVEELYRLHEVYVELATEAPTKLRWTLVSSNSGAALDQGDFRERTEGFWAGVVRSADGVFLTRAHQRLTHQLAGLRRLEDRFFDDWRSELAELEAVFAKESSAEFIDLNFQYHRRRIQQSRALSAALREERPADSNI